MAKAFLFPGQGSQFVGMGKEHYHDSNTFSDLADRANRVLGFSLTDIMFEGPAEKLKQTEYTQPAIFLHSVGLFRAMNKTPDMTAGHSLGEFSAIVAAGAAGFEDMLKIVRKRGELMQRAGAENPGTMAAVIGMEDSVVEDVCREASEETGREVVPANYNCPGQLVISGDRDAVQKAVEGAKERGCRLAKVLPVSGAFHSSLMKPAYDGLKEELQKMSLDKPGCPVYCNYTARPTVKPEQVRSNLLNQLLNPVQWTRTMQNMHKDGASVFVEVGPGNVLQGLVKRTLDEVEIQGYR